MIRWYVIYTRSRHEKKVEELLLQQGIEAWCPKITVARAWSDRVKKVVEPLFRSYVFVHIDEKERFEVFKTPGIVKFVNFRGELATLKPAEIKKIRSLLNDFDPSHVSVESLSPNDRVVVSSGAFMDAEGVILETKGRILTVYLETLGMKVRFDYNKNIIEKVVSL
ncbi:MAG: UpxY family transcription antiterminator [Bacteroidetes bacterium]|nr:UpxY family transcription antiterminator [Bacteroidota bacterium]